MFEFWISLCERQWKTESTVVKKNGLSNYDELSPNVTRFLFILIFNLIQFSISFYIIASQYTPAITVSQPAFTCSKSIMETSQQFVKPVQS